MRISSQLSLLLVVFFGTILFSGTVEAQCKSENVNLKIKPHGLWLTPHGEPKCLYTSDLSDVDVNFEIDLRTPGPYQLRDGQVHVRQVPIKVVNGADVACGEELEFAEDEYTNTGEANIVINVIGTDVPDDDEICYEIVVDDIGTIDPRARVQQNASLSINIADELAEIIDAYDDLIETALGDGLAGTSLDDFTQENYGMSEADARDMTQKYREQEH